MHLISAGSDHMRTLPIYQAGQIPITNSSGIHGAIIAEWVIMTLLMASRRYKVLRQWQDERDWDESFDAKDEFHDVTDSVGKRLGILGYGSIGRQVARVAKAMGMEIIAFTANPRETAESKRDHGFVIPGIGDPEGEFPSAWFSGLDKASLHKFLEQDLDFLLICLPLTSKTRYLLGKDEFRILGKRNAFVTNIARGEILVQKDLIAALEEYEDFVDGSRRDKRGGLRGAALDVADPEPLPADNELWSAPNVIITPHISGVNRDYSIRALEVLEQNLKRLASGERLLNLEDRNLGYAPKM